MGTVNHPAPGLDDMNESSRTLIVSRRCPAPEFRALTYPRFRPFLALAEPGTKQPDCLVIGATRDGTPIGLALLSPLYGDGERRLFSVFVLPRFRRQGIGSKLLSAAEGKALEAGTRRLIAYHSNRSAGYTGYEGLVRKAGWRGPEPLEYRLAGRADWIYRAERDWGKFLARAKRGGFNTMSWTELTEENREQIARLVADELPQPDKTYDPLSYNPPNLVPAISVVLRCGEDIAGWVLGQKGWGEGSYHYTHGYALPKYQKRGYLIIGMMEACRRQADLFGPDTMSTYEARDAGMKRLMQQRIKPYSEWTDERFVCRKTIGNAASGS